MDLVLCIILNIQHCFIGHPSEATVSEDTGIEGRTVATFAVVVRRSNNSARSQPLLARYPPHSARSHPHTARSQQALLSGRTEVKTVLNKVQ